MRTDNRRCSGWQKLGWVLLAVLCGVGPLGASAAGQDDSERVRALVRAAQEEMHRFREAGGEEGDPEHPARRWADRLWRYREEHPGTRAAALATSESLHLRIHAGQFDEALLLARSLRSGEADWTKVIDVLREAESISGEDGFFVDAAADLLETWTDPGARDLLQLSLAEAYWQRGDIAAARAGFQLVVGAAQDESLIRQAAGYVHELDHLQPGQPAPEIAGTARDGSEISLAALRGRPVLIIYWASW